MSEAPCSLCARSAANHDDAACPMGWTPALPARPTKLLVCGSRDWPEAERATIHAWLARFPPGTTIIHGAARGADSLAASVAQELGFAVRAYPARWEEEGKAAGPLRNQRMLDGEPGIERVLAFTSALQGGTGDMVARAVAAGVVVTVIPPGRGPR